MLYPLGNPVYEQELSRYIQEQGEDNVATIYADLLAMVSEEVQEPISFEKLAYLTRGLEIMVRKHSVKFRLKHFFANNSNFHKILF